MWIPGDGAIAETLTSITITSNTNYAIYLLKKLVCSTISMFVVLQTVASRTMASRYSAWVDLAIECLSKDWRTKRGTGVIEHAFTSWIRSAY